MKKILFAISIFFISLFGVSAKNYVYKIDMDIYLDEDGNAKITEVWDVKGSDGTEWYKALGDLGNSELSNFTVSMDETKLTYKTWNVNESLSEKKGYYGINYDSSGSELCFGKYDFNRHTFTLNYELSNFIINTSDSQVLYWTLINRLTDVEFQNYSITVTSYYNFPDTLDVWGYGYKGYAYIKDGKIEMSNEGDMDDNYVTLLVKFPLNTFNTTNIDSRYSTFDDIYKAAEEGTFDYEYEYDNNYSFFDDIFGFIITFIIIGGSLIPFIFGIKKISSSNYGYKDNKKINQKDIPYFREIPCNKDIYYANALLKINNLYYKEANILGSILLKWVREDKIVFTKEKSGVFNKKNSVIDLTKNPTFNNENEQELFSIMYKASKDGYLESNEFSKWTKKNYDQFFSLFIKIAEEKEDELKRIGYIKKRKSKEECKKKYVMNDIIYDESVKLYGSRKYLLDFSSMDTKEVLDVKLWDEYLMFAYLFGIADKVAKELKNMYPELINQSNFDYDTILLVNNFSYTTVNAANAARSAANSYSSGGGGFSSGGGGGGSFGGGGGGGSR